MFHRLHTASQDIDLGLLLPDEPDLMDLGELAGRVEDICRRPVDIVRLRGLPERDPELAFRIADEGVPILESRRFAFADFKKEAFLWYMNTAPLRRMRKRPCISVFDRAIWDGEIASDSIARLLPLLDRLDDLRAFAHWDVSLEQE